MPSGLYLGAGSAGPIWAPDEHSVLVLGPPRSGKTSSLVVPAVLAASGAVVSTSTKPDVLRITASARSRHGPTLVYDPSGTVEMPSGVQRVQWSPVPGCLEWDDALLVARSLVGATRTASGGASGFDHWAERAEALLAPLLHAAALDGAELATVLSWVDRRQGGAALGVLDGNGAAVAGDLLAGIVATDQREQSGIWSTASGVLSAYRSRATLATTVAPDFDAAAFCDSSATLYICATGRHQALTAPLVVGLLNEIRGAAYARAVAGAPSASGRSEVAGPSSHPVVFALDEVANIAPLPDLPAIVSEGGGQGLVTLACFQDLSQARARWGEAAEGFLSLFGTTVVLPGIGDLRTLEALSSLAGEQEVRTQSVSTPVAVGGSVARAALGAVLGSTRRSVPSAPTVTTSVVLRRRLPVDVVARGQRGMGLVVDDRNQMGWIRLTPWFATEPWRSTVLGTPEISGPRRPAPSRELGAGLGI